MHNCCTTTTVTVGLQLQVELPEFQLWYERQDADAREQLLLLDSISFADLPPV